MDSNLAAINNPAGAGQATSLQNVLGQVSTYSLTTNPSAGAAGNNFIRVPGLFQEIGFPIQEIGFPIQETEAGQAPYLTRSSDLQYSVQNFVQRTVSTYHTVVTDVTGAVSVYYEMKSTYEAETVVTVPSEQSQPLEQSYTQEEFYQLSTTAFECSLGDNTPPPNIQFMSGLDDEQFLLPENDDLSIELDNEGNPAIFSTDYGTALMNDFIESLQKFPPLDDDFSPLM